MTGPFFEENGGWWFFGEDSEKYGPYPSREEAHRSRNLIRAKQFIARHNVQPDDAARFLKDIDTPREISEDVRRRIEQLENDMNDEDT